MVFVKGDPNINYAGRPKGALNKATELRQEIEDAIRHRLKEMKSMPIKDLVKVWATLQPKDIGIRVKPDIEFVSHVPRPQIEQDKPPTPPEENKSPEEDKKISADRGPNNGGSPQTGVSPIFSNGKNKDVTQPVETKEVPTIDRKKDVEKESL